jgi:uncharacterized membrane protein YkoI
MKLGRRSMMVGGAVVAISAGAAGAAMATSGDDEGGVSGPGADRATQAALAITHGGTANSVERDTENGATWEVEVTKPDGQTVDVRLDENYGIVVVEGDSENSDSPE